MRFENNSRMTVINVLYTMRNHKNRLKGYFLSWLGGIWGNPVYGVKEKNKKRFSFMIIIIEINIQDSLNLCILLFLIHIHSFCDPSPIFLFYQNHT